MADSLDDFELIPSDEDDLSPEDDLSAAASSAIADGQVQPEDPPPPDPFGTTWAFDFDAGRFIMAGSQPARVSGLEAAKQWCLMAAHTARYAHPIFSDDFGVDRPQGPIGFAGVSAVERADDFRVSLRDALLVHDRFTDVQMAATYDPVQGGVFLSDFTVTSDEGDVVRMDDVFIPYAPEA